MRAPLDGITAGVHRAIRSRQGSATGAPSGATPALHSGPVGIVSPKRNDVALDGGSRCLADRVVDVAWLERPDRGWCGRPAAATAHTCAAPA